jgi:DnaJ family protein C protein 17
MEDYYQVLQVEPTATIQEIRKAYRTLSLKYHPDRAGDSQSAAEMFQLITKALDTLIDPAKKKVHDDFYQANVLRKRRNMEMDAKRQELKQKLEKGEMEAKKPKFGNDLDRLRDAGKQAMLAREQQQRQSLAVKISKAQEIQAARKSVEECSVQDCTLKVRWKKNATISEKLIADFLKPYTVVSINLSKSGKRSGFVIFKTLVDSVFGDNLVPGD